MALKISEEAAVQMPMKTVASLICLVAIGTWAYFGIIEKQNKLSTTQAVQLDKVSKLERQVEKLEDKMDKMMDSDEEIMDQHKKLFEKLESGNTGYSYN